MRPSRISLEGWSSVGGALLGSTPSLDSGRNAAVLERHESYNLQRWLADRLPHLPIQLGLTDNLSRFLFGVFDAIPLEALC